MRGKRLWALCLSAALTASLLGGCASRAKVTEDMIPAVTDLREGEGQEEAADVIGLAMNKSYVAELTRMDGDNTEMASVDAKSISVVLKATSVDKDLKVKIVNEKNNRVITGTEFEVSVTDSDKKTKNYKDEDKDGIIHIKSMTPGKCSISLKSTGGYSAAKDITADVKANIDYKVVDITDEIKKESEINVSKEDSNANGNSGAGTAVVHKDTVEWVESSKTEVYETTKVQKKDAFGQPMYTKQKTDDFGTPMYAKILSEPASYHKDGNGDGKCDRCGAALHQHTYEWVVVKEAVDCQTPGVQEYRCSCGDVAESKGITKDHTVDTATGKCTVCGAQVQEPVAPPTEGGTEEPTTPPTEGEGQPVEGSGVNPTPAEEKDAADALRENGSGQEARRFRIPELRANGLRLVATASEKIVYDTSSAPVYDTGSEPVYEEVKTLTGYKYTGWQTIDGATYYFDKNGNKVTGNQVIQGIQYTFSSEGVRSGTIGIDVSKFQPSVNWKKVKNAGINFVIIRCGYRGYGSGVLVEDPMFASHITGAKAAGLRVGVYFFSQAITEAEAVEEASMAVKLANRYGINMPIAIDSEYANGGSGRADRLSRSERTKITKAFCNTVANAGHTPMVYASKSWFGDHLDVSQFPGSYRIWVAHYADKCGYKGRYDIWQNTSKGSVDGIPGNVDMNISSI